MTSAHRYPQHPPNPPKLPSLRDLNFYRPSGGQAALPPSQQPEQPVLQPEQPPQPARHQVVWGRSPANSYPSPSSAAAAAHQQYAPQLSSGHEVTPKVEYPQKHENTGYAHPGMPLSAQANPVPGSVNPGLSRTDDASHSPTQPKKRRTASTTASRDVRGSHANGYPPPQYATYAHASQPQSAGQYHPVQQSLPSAPPSHATQPAPPPHEQIQHHPHPVPVPAHPGYAPYQSAYVHPRQTLLHPHISQPDHPSSYPSSAPPPPSAPPPQGPWAHQQQPQFQQQQPTPVPQPPQQNPPPAHIPPQHQHHQQQQQQAPAPPPPAQPSQQQQHHQHPPPPASHPHPHQIQQTLQYPHQQQQQQQYQPQYQHPPQQQQQQQAPPFVRPTAINPSSLENRPTYSAAEPPRVVPPVHNDSMSEITNHCNVLYNFANRYAALQQSMPHVQPPPEELEEMSQRAMAVVRLLADFRRITIPESAQPPPSATGNPPPASVPLPQDPPSTGESSRPPKRPWEDTVQEEGASGEANGFQDQFSANPPADPKAQSTAEQDMEIIRTKRATSTAVANGTGGQPKSKYRKRSRASPPGKCHSCNIRETPEWRRGPDGARTLCNACGLHYAKLMRKQNKAAVNGEVPHIDLETLRASTRAADIAEKGRSDSSKPSKPTNQKSSDPTSPVEASSSSSAGKQSAPPPPQATHQGSFQLVNMMAPSQDQNMSQNHGHVHGPNPSSSSSTSGATPMQVDSRPASKHASSSTPQMQAMAPPPPTAPSHHPHHAGPHQQHPPPLPQAQPSSGPGGSSHPPPPPWPTTAATTGPAATAGASTLRATRSTGGGHAQYNGPPPPSPLELIRRQYSVPNRSSGGQQQQQQPSR